MKQGILCRYSQVEHSPGLKDQAELSQQQEGGREPLVLDLQIWTEFKPLINHIIHLSVLIPSCTGKTGFVHLCGFCKSLTQQGVLPRTGSSSGGNADRTHWTSAQELVKVVLPSWSKAAVKLGC